MKYGVGQLRAIYRQQHTACCARRTLSDGGIGGQRRVRETYGDHLGLGSSLQGCIRGTGVASTLDIDIIAGLLALLCPWPGCGPTSLL